MRRAAKKICWIVAVSCVPIWGWGQTTAPEMPAGKLVQEAVQNELAAAKDGGGKHMFHSRKQTPKGSQTKLYVETTEAMAGMLVAINDQPLTPEQQQGELEHLGWLLQNPDQLRKKQLREKEDAERTLRIVKALPDAFRYQYAAAESGDGPGVARLTFTPNPEYSPPSRVEQALSGMEGYLLISIASKRLARIDGKLFRDVSFGWGLIGRLDKGSTFQVQQADVGNGAWEVTEMHLKVTGKILLFKGLNLASDEVFSDFRAVPDGTTFAQGVELLKKEREKAVSASSTSGTKTTPQ